MNNGRLRTGIQADTEKKSRELPQKAVMNGYKRRVRPREVNRAVEKSPAAIDRNLRKINKRYIAVPKTAGARYALKTANAKSNALVTEKTRSARPFPLLTILGCILITAVFMYMLSLYIKIDDYNSDISAIKSEIADLSEDATVLQVGIESKFNLDMVEKVAVEEYGMVSADSLQKTYVSVTSEDIGEVIEPVKKKGGLGSLFSAIAAELNLG